MTKASRSKGAAGAAPEEAQAEATRPRPIDGAGRTLDAHGLPLGGPARARALAELGKPDPHDDPAAWGDVVDEAATADPAGADADKPAAGDAAAQQQD